MNHNQQNFTTHTKVQKTMAIEAIYVQIQKSQFEITINLESFTKHGEITKMLLGEHSKGTFL